MNFCSRRQFPPKEADLDATADFIGPTEPLQPLWNFLCNTRDLYIENAYPILLGYAFLSNLKEISLQKFRFRLHLHLIVVQSGVMFVFFFPGLGHPELLGEGWDLRCPHGSFSVLLRLKFDMVDEN